MSYKPKVTKLKSETYKGKKITFNKEEGKEEVGTYWSPDIVSYVKVEGSWNKNDRWQS